MLFLMPVICDERDKLWADYTRTLAAHLANARVPRKGDKGIDEIWRLKDAAATARTVWMKHCMDHGCQQVIKAG
jgi:hypothetical protein